MSNSIWKTGDPTYRNDNFDEIIVREYKRWATDGVFYLVDYCTELPNRWAYLLDIIAQADKAERLEKENEAMREEFEVWHENYKCEVEDKERLQKVVFFLTGHLRDVLQLDEYGHIKLDEITKQQIKNAISDPVGIIMQLEQESNN